ncbi:hypothetical protein [Ensifer adhaerens]|uniref:hypothetical protein n=1 Tax=Ensifer adhaerens TaxID=106592 RepID=UPI00202E76E6|nr:hypothetical protein [Ensifer adhaerens]
MAWFVNVLVQWVIIAALVVFALLSRNVYAIAFASIVVFGLITYGFLNPAFMVRRAIVWAATAIVAAYLLPAIPVEPVIDHLAPHLPSFLVAGVRLALYLLNTEISPWVIAPLALLVMLEIATQVVANKPAAERDFYVMPGRPFGVIARVNPSKLVFDHTIVVTNKTANTVVVTNASLQMSRFGAQAVTELYESSKPDQISVTNPMVLPPDASKALDVVCRTPGKFAERMVGLVDWCGLRRFVDFHVSIQLFGNLSQSDTRLRLTYNLTRHRPPQ